MIDREKLFSLGSLWNFSDSYSITDRCRIRTWENRDTNLWEIREILDSLKFPGDYRIFNTSEDSKHGCIISVGKLIEDNVPVLNLLQNKLHRLKILVGSCSKEGLTEDVCNLLVELNI